MAQIINIAGLTPVDDPSYRYKMPKLVGKVEGRGNGIKTVLVNVVDVGASLNREAPEITKFFGCELGSQTTYAADTERAIVNGAHREADLQQHLCRYIEFFVLCKNCRLPETHYKIKDGRISQKCLACGSKDVVDMNHKLTAFILAQHKKAKDATKGDKKAEKKKEKKQKKQKGEKGGDDDAGAEEGADGATSPGKDAAKEGKKSKKEGTKKSSSKKADKLGENVFGIKGGEEDDDDEDGEEEDEEEEESDSRAAEEGMDRLKLWLSNQCPGVLPPEDSPNSAAANPSVPPPADLVRPICDELRNIQTMASLRPADRIIIYLGAVFSEKMVERKEVALHSKVLAELAGTAIQQRHLIAAFEWLCGTKYPAKVKFFPVLLKQLLDEELVEEDTFLAWAADFTRNEYSAEQSMLSTDTLEQLKASAAPFITWLQEAEEEEDDDDDDDEEEDDED
mmetsp:Transcript_33414/g.56091  ORF Transcript_33414/g.56091 Transcript_33414/m.56091 type:complete len:452 (+) Transcript_33414:397-1752(+)